jgi:hypothetical protein
MGMNSQTLQKRQSRGGVLSLSLTVVLASAALCVAGLGTLITISVMQTSGYSFGSVGMTFGYLFLVLLMPVVWSIVRHDQSRGDLSRLVRSSSSVSLVAELIFVPLIFLIFKM